MDTDTPILRLRTPAEILTAIPYMFGFQPAESLVVLGLAGKRVGLRARVDLPTCEEDVEAVTGALVDPLRRNDAEQALVVLYRDADGPPDDLDRSVHMAMGAALTLGDVRIRDAIAVRGDRWYSLSCLDPQCCPVEGTPLRSDGRVASELVYRGAHVVASRADHVGRIAPLAPDSPAAIRIGQALDDAEDELLERLHARGPDALRRALITETRARYGRLLDDAEATGARPAADDIAWLLFPLVHVLVRDALVADTVRRRDVAIPVLVELVRAAPDDLIPPAATLLGIASWRAGDGALALDAFERALTADPEYRFALLLIQGLSGGLAPSWLDGLADVDVTRPVASQKRRKRKRRAA